MSRFEDEQILSFGKNQEFRFIVPSAGASIAVSYWNGVDYTPDEASPITAPRNIYTKGCRIKFTPTGGGYLIDTDGI